jgi:hypothetical protein
VLPLEVTDDAFSEIADEQLDALELGDPAAYRDVLLLCRLVFDHTSRAKAMSSAIITDQGIVMRLAVPGHSPLKLFWSVRGADGRPRIEAVIEHPTH